jgi:hypothetical protein
MSVFFVGKKEKNNLFSDCNIYQSSNSSNRFVNGATDGILPNPFNIYKVLYFKEFIDVNMNIVVT